MMPEEMAPIIKPPKVAKSITIEGDYDAEEGVCLFNCKAPYDPKD